MTRSELIAQLKTSKDITPDDHNGCYELVRCVVDMYSQRGTEGLDHHDLYLLYVMTLGDTSFNEKKKKIEESNLDVEAKKKLVAKLAKVQEDTELGKYDCKKNGMFGSGFGTFARGKSIPVSDQVSRFIKLCIQINRLSKNNEDEALDLAEEALSKKIPNLGAASASEILHCLRPGIFPIINSNQGKEDPFVYLGINLKNKSDLTKYVSNTRKIKAFRDENFSFKNYRVIDLCSSFLDSEACDPDMSVGKSKPGSNIILYGPPGTGKTYNVAAMAWLISRGIDPTLENVRSLTDEQRVEAKMWYDAELTDHENGHIAFTTFHQSYGYEEFIEGIRPIIPENNDLEVENDIGYALEDGVFKAFCNRASASDADGNDDPYVFVIDEINRGNISKVFGELITLIEPSKRIGQPDQQIAILPYTKKPFGVPANVTIIGTMNTADRSIALMDTALRRRFRFIEMMPDYDALQCIPEFDGISISKLVECMNRRISVLYDREHTIGHAYFMELVEEPNINTLATIFEECIIPLLQEYFYDDYEKICLVLGDNQKSDDAIKFFVEINSYTSDELFGVTAAYDDVCSYQMNRKALDDPQAYIGIYSQA